VGRVATLLQAGQQLLEGELALADADRVDVREDRVLRLDDRVNAAPDLVRVGAQLAHALDDPRGEIGVAGHRGVADQLGVLEALRHLVDLLVTDVGLVADRARDRAAHAAPALRRRDVTGLRVRLELGHVRRHLAKAARGDAILEADHLRLHFSPFNI